MAFGALADECVHEIFVRLKAYEISNLRTACREIAAAGTAPALWQRLCDERFRCAPAAESARATFRDRWLRWSLASRLPLQLCPAPDNWLAPHHRYPEYELHAGLADGLRAAFNADAADPRAMCVRWAGTFADARNDETVGVAIGRSADGGGLPPCALGPAGARVRYFEALVVNGGAGARIAVGWCRAGYPATCKQPGWDPHSYGCESARLERWWWRPSIGLSRSLSSLALISRGLISCRYHGDDGRAYRASGWGAPFAPTFAAGDVVGSGLWSRGRRGATIFFTLNGELVGAPFEHVKAAELLHPAVGLHSPGEAVELNFAGGFAFDLAGHVATCARAIAAEAGLRDADDDDDEADDDDNDDDDDDSEDELDEGAARAIPLQNPPLRRSRALDDASCPLSPCRSSRRRRLCATLPAHHERRRRVRRDGAGAAPLPPGASAARRGGRRRRTG